MLVLAVLGSKDYPLAARDVCKERERGTTPEEQSGREIAETRKRGEGDVRDESP